jgi:hypothetical protein
MKIQPESRGFAAEEDGMDMGAKKGASPSVFARFLYIL